MFTSTPFFGLINRYQPLWFFVILLWLAAPSSAQTLPAGFASSQVQSGYETPVGTVFSTDGQQLFVWDKGGRVWVSTWNGTTYVRQNTPVLDISEEVGNWRDFGLLSACLDPNFSSNGLLYLFYVVDRHHLLHYGTAQYNKASDEYFNASISRVTRYRVTTAGGKLTADETSRQVLIGETKTTGIPLTYESHAGGTLVFGRDGTLLVSTGDNASYDAVDIGSDSRTYYQTAIAEGIMRPAENVGALRAQMPGSFCGKVLRINPNTGDGVSSNPYFDGANPRAPKSRVWALGLRNPYRMSIQPNTGSTNADDGRPGTLLVGDVGWYTTEDLHILNQGGLNCGWPLYEGLETAQGYYGRYVRNEDEPGRPTFESLCQQPASAAVDGNPANRRFTHSRPALDWNHDASTARVPAFDGTTPITRLIGTAGAPAGTPFKGNASMGGAYYTGSQFPEAYRNTYFFADFGQNWIKNLVLHDDGDHQIHEVRAFAPSGFGQGIVDLEVNPLDGSLFYVNVSGDIMRISYGGNQPPTARPVASVTSGSSPLRVQFSGSTSTDPEGRPLQFQWNFGDGSTSREANPEHVFTSTDARRFTATLIVTDEGQLTDTKEIVISLNSVAPTAQITSPADGSLYAMDRTSTYTLNANVTGENLTYEWQLWLQHNTHEHAEPILREVNPQIRISPVGCSTTESYSYRISLKVTNASGLSASTSVRIYPDCRSGSNAVRQVTATPLPNSVRVNWQNPPVSFDEVMVVSRVGTGFQNHPTGTDYTADADFTGRGTPFDGGKVVYRGRDEAVVVRNLTQSAPHFFRIFTRIGDTWNEGIEVSATPQVGEPTGGTLSLIAPLYNCSTGAITFRTTGGNGTPIEFSAVGITGWTPRPDQTVESGVRGDPKVIILNARQSGIQVSYTFDLPNACSATGPSANRPPVATAAIGTRSATRLQPFTLSIPANTFTDPENQFLTYSVSGLPEGLSFDRNTTTISGQPTTSGQFTVTVTATDSDNLSASTSFLIVVNQSEPPQAPTPTAPNPTGFALTGATMVSCESLSAGQRQITFTPQYTGLTGQPVSFSVVSEMIPTTSPGPYTLRVYTDNPAITLKATQVNSTNEASFVYNWLAACTGGNPAPNPSGNRAPQTANSIPDQQTQTGQAFSFTIPANTFVDPDGDALTLTINELPDGLRFDSNSGTISGQPTTAGRATVVVTATDPGNRGTSASFLLTVGQPAPTTTPTPGPAPTGFSITGVTMVKCESLSAGQRQITFTPQYAGLTGQPVSFSVVREMLPTTNPGPYTLRIYTDNPVITLQAEQMGTAGTASFTYDWRAVCERGSGRLGSEAREGLTVRVLGNPVLTNQGEVEIRGAEGQRLRLQTFNERGYLVYETTIAQPASVERSRVDMVGPAGLYLLRVSTTDQFRVVKLMKQ
ncbi:putative Ig domain-containing protein [Spirosoma utsteinense]|uniref:Glucose/arabinose dehydrogenase n=1 Tax=Spirosoma utsteinense TaxID=2585773 RepID=A0ABR6W655_9BACT|nr:putative Ig domain-containing protein [Spirosoma utsteinense]MBC3792048.1 glucose/arabinose dehydrogenase [Spirosoma utsteinense]